MATYYFVGGEDADFLRIGNTAVNTATTAARRTANARCALTTGFANIETTGWAAQLSTTVTSCWVTGRIYIITLSSPLTTHDLIAFTDGTTRRLMVTVDGGGFARARISKQNAAGTRSVLATGSIQFEPSVLYKIDVQVISYGASGTVNVYVDGLLWVTYTGDLTTDGATSLSGLVFGNLAVNATHHWSEMICSDEDTRPMSLVTLPPAADGNTFAWTNSYTAIDEITTDDTDLSASGTADQLAQTTVTSSGIVGTPAILAVAVNARAMRGATGPQNLQLNVRTASTDYFSSNVGLTTTFAKTSNVWATNPNTAAAWTYTDITGSFNVGVKSIT